MLTGTAFLTTDEPVSMLGEKRLRGRDVERPYRGVRAVGLDRAAVMGRCQTYEPRMSTSEFFSHVTAAQLYRMPLPSHVENATTLHVSTFRSVARPRVREVVGHRLSAGAVGTQFHRGFVVADPVSTWCHLASVLSVDDLIAVGDFIVSGRVTDYRREPPLASLAELHAGAKRFAGLRSARRRSEAIACVRTGVDSRPESLLRMLLVRSGLPEPAVNEETFDDRGNRLGKPDLTYEWARTVFEYEGDGHRTDKKRFRRDIFRRELFEDADWRVIRVISDDLFVDSAAFIRRTRRTLERRAADLASGQ